MPDYRVSAVGRDPNGRTIYMTAYMRNWWERVVAELGFRPTITQGAFMARAGGGAAASAGYHDLGGCLDLRVWDLSAARVELLIRTLRRQGAAAWLRDQRHGMDPHIHLVLGTDEPLTGGASSQWRAYINGRNGLASNGPDYHWRPSPLVLKPPEDDMPYTPDELAKIVRAAVRAELEAVGLDDLARLERDRAVIDRRKHGETKAAVDEHDQG